MDKLLPPPAGDSDGDVSKGRRFAMRLRELVRGRQVRGVGGKDARLVVEVEVGGVEGRAAEETRGERRVHIDDGKR